MQSQLGNISRYGYCKFFRGLIASLKPEEIVKVVNRYQKNLKATEAGYMDIIIKSNGLISYQELMAMPLDSILIFVERLNQIKEEQHQAEMSARRRS